MPNDVANLLQRLKDLLHECQMCEIHRNEKHVKNTLSYYYQVENSLADNDKMFAAVQYLMQ